MPRLLFFGWLCVCTNADPTLRSITNIFGKNRQTSSSRASGGSSTTRPPGAPPARYSRWRLFRVCVLSVQWSFCAHVLVRPAHTHICFTNTIHTYRHEQNTTYKLVHLQVLTSNPHKKYICKKLTEDLADISSIMKKNIQEVLNRGEKLDSALCWLTLYIEIGVVYRLYYCARDCLDVRVWCIVCRVGERGAFTYIL